MTYLRALEDIDRAFPEVSTDIHGAHRDAQGGYWIECIKQQRPPDRERDLEPAQARPSAACHR